jgi:hypothetical protein
MFDGVRWKKSSGADDPSPRPAAPDAIPTQLEVGMTAAQLDQLLGRPSVTTVMRSAATFDEIRVYGRQGEGSRLIVQLRRGPGQTQFLVTRFDSR